MILVFALLGVIVGWLLELAADILIRFSSAPASHSSPSFRPPAVWRLARPSNGATDWVEVGFEVIGGILFALFYARHGVSLETLWLIIAYAFFALITIMDYKYRIVLNILTYPGLVIALVMNIVVLRQPVLPILLGTVFAFGIFYVTAMVRPGGLGGGDVKLAALIGAAFGFPQVLWVLIVSAAASALAIILLLVVRHRTPKDSMPYAPFLCLGAIAILIYSSMMTLS